MRQMQITRLDHLLFLIVLCCVFKLIKNRLSFLFSSKCYNSNYYEVKQLFFLILQLKKEISYYIHFKCEFQELPNEGCILLYRVMCDTVRMHWGIKPETLHFKGNQHFYKDMPHFFAILFNFSLLTKLFYSIGLLHASL